ncbi:MAG: sulfite exporter TauE/SafE family protein [Nocardiopsaceae bacterium]|nr:sulfite exporter TauE/SafE family protein [Nocardiopsaceae bacterium]
MPDIWFLVIAGTAVLLGAIVQSSVGLGLGLVAAPVVAFLDPALIPGAMLITTSVLPVFSLMAEWRHIDWRGLAWAIPGRILGSAAGVWVVASLAPELLGAAVGAMVLVAAGLSIRSIRVRVTPASLLTAGAVSGMTGTATSIGGPPIALLYQHETGPRVRATLAGFFLFGVGVSLLLLAVGGQLHEEEVRAGLWLIPFVVAGFLVGRPLRRAVDAGKMRVALLSVVTASGLVLLVRSLL